MSNDVIVVEDEITARLTESLELAIEDSIKTVLGVEDVDVSVDIDMSSDVEDVKMSGTFSANWSDEQAAEEADEIEPDDE